MYIISASHVTTCSRIDHEKANMIHTCTYVAVYQIHLESIKYVHSCAHEDYINWTDEASWYHTSDFEKLYKGLVYVFVQLQQKAD